MAEKKNCFSVSVGLTPLRRRAGETLMLNEDESKQFWNHLELVREDIREFFKHTYDLHVEGFDDKKLICNVFSLGAFETFWNDLKNDSARMKFEKALDFHESDPLILLDVSAVVYYKAKEFFSTTCTADPLQRSFSSSYNKLTEEMSSKDAPPPAAVGEKMKLAVGTSDHSCSTVTTVFQLYIPEAMPEAKSVWMDIVMADRSSQHIKLMQCTTQPRLWFAVCTVTSGLSYHYSAKVSAWLGLKTAKISEDNLRVTTKNSIHRDIFKSVEKNVVDRTDGWQFFFEETINDIGRPEIQCDIQKLLCEYFQLDHHNLRSIDQHELGRFAVECALKVGLNPFVAAFVIYYLSCIFYDKPESLYYSNIQPNAALQLLNTLKGWPLQQVLGPCFGHKITEVLFSLVRVCRIDSADVWSSFVLFCYPSLSSTEILCMPKPRDYHPSSQLIRKLCSCINEEEAEQILRAIIPFVTYLPSLCEVFEAYSLSDVPDRWTLLDKYRPNIVNCVQMQLDKLTMTWHLKELNDMAAHIFSVDSASMNEVLPSFEQAFLKILDRREDASHYMQQLDEIITNPVVFTDKSQAIKLFQIFVRSSQRSHHVLFPKFLQLQKFSMLFDDDTVMQLIDQWLGRVASVMPTLSSEPKSVRDLHKRVFHVSNMPDHVLRTADMKKEIKKRCMITFCDVALPNIIRLPNVSHWKF